MATLENFLAVKYYSTQLSFLLFLNKIFGQYILYMIVLNCVLYKYFCVQGVRPRDAHPASSVQPDLGLWAGCRRSTAAGRTHLKLAARLCPLNQSCYCCYHPPRRCYLRRLRGRRRRWKGRCRRRHHPHLCSRESSLAAPYQFPFFVQK